MTTSTDDDVLFLLPVVGHIERHVEGIVRREDEYARVLGALDVDDVDHVALVAHLHLVAGLGLLDEHEQLHARVVLDLQRRAERDLRPTVQRSHHVHHVVAHRLKRRWLSESGGHNRFRFAVALACNFTLRRRRR